MLAQGKCGFRLSGTPRLFLLWFKPVTKLEFPNSLRIKLEGRFPMKNMLLLQGVDCGTETADALYQTTTILPIKLQKFLKLVYSSLPRVVEWNIFSFACMFLCGR